MLSCKHDNRIFFPYILFSQQHLFSQTSSRFIFKPVINICNVTLEHVYQMMSQHLGIKVTASKKATLRTYAIKIGHPLQESVISGKIIKGDNYFLCQRLKVLPCSSERLFGMSLIFGMDPTNISAVLRGIEDIIYEKIRWRIQFNTHLFLVLFWIFVSPFSGIF
ncbi:hypothetical protein PHYBLDRAFT_68999 [Phycomyces blakesleeanus NRRL 1555(-)]|uniref:Uncharacterized protein n=1 Tax=Phycomyces blakesleeanus (strain ATCC 8743b / DSM 1359 / FGSC 10004 / NBRC 33097 / NRRL 1555) TaxID=763407 RepID=A0A167KMM6_PHYB8|nr:hypothetical protein PHYBLDRAFT_68999 [Phycomyces blakesleeanus NRRL 1555(-)]OAD68439.1 hypothetical protein PHYBLDRAFT_68999 [Phycomyces blakesleeanus NRRL 1555(-)]|eukprot:XP_018286479.1 hypothetical protein PHYBLDRAFT_68999 [Phycomyces blakesleeanus NRRL 1555(-)]